ncbi:hypothetical protein BJY04DRAFT_196799 [Aspergillus karnatakaensis]|uniref:uncharacterized protein n=1 Tax=Aspergillus karnatakaensis TaxID=1810916 RepID=UPI003CCD1F9B
MSQLSFDHRNAEYRITMALVSPTHLLTLHNASETQIRSLQFNPSRKYDYVSKFSRATATGIPDPSIFRSLPKENTGGRALPTVSECAIHLEMLEAFHTLRNDIIHSRKLDDTFDIHPTPTTVYRKKRENRKYVIETASIKDRTFAERRKTKWTQYLRLATIRFHDWITLVDGHLANAKNGGSTPKWLLLPPLDVLVIWHAFLLNCDDFKSYCEGRNLAHIQSIAFPWAQIHAAIDSTTYQYTLPIEHREWLTNSKIDPDLFEACRAASRRDGMTKNFLSVFDRCHLPGTWEEFGGPTLAQAGSISNKALVENVERQCVFVDKMHGHRWIRSPAVEGTLRRAIDRYDKFLHLFRLHPNVFLVPTLDVDLVWHTHQCSAASYRGFVTERVGRFINHEDKIGRDTLDDGFTSAEQWYRLRFGEQYQVCLCWSCEAILSAVEELDDEMLSQIEPPVADLSKAVEEKVHYYREAETARRLGRAAPIWNH